MLKDRSVTIRIPDRQCQIVERIAAKERCYTSEVYRFLIDEGIKSVLGKAQERAPE
jgi:hypothetical protein